MSTALPCNARSHRQSFVSSGPQRSQVDWLLLHQANQRILDAVAERMNIPSHKVISNPLWQYLCRLYPPRLDQAVQGQIQPNDIIAASGFGAGLTLGPQFSGAGRELSPRWELRSKL